MGTRKLVGKYNSTGLKAKNTAERGLWCSMPAWEWVPWWKALREQSKPSVGLHLQIEQMRKDKVINLHRWKATPSIITSQWKLRTSNQHFQIILHLVPSVLCFIGSFPSINPSYRLNCLLNHSDVTKVRMENSLTARNFRTPQKLIL